MVEKLENRSISSACLLLLVPVFAIWVLLMGVLFNLVIGAVIGSLLSKKIPEKGG